VKFQTAEQKTWFWNSVIHF